MTTPRLMILLCLAPVAALGDPFDDWDANKDGKLQKDELPRWARRNFERVDRDRDGTISREEHEGFTKRARARQTGGGPSTGSTGESKEFEILKDLDYVGDGEARHTLDLFLPHAKAEKPRPLVVFIHGGAWRAGSKAGALGRLRPYLSDGRYAGAALNYRLTGEAGWPAQIHDCKAAIRWLKGHAVKYGYDAERVAVWGTSAGGHLVAMLGVTGDVPELEGELGKHLDQSSSVACVVDYFGPSNLLTMDDYPSDIEHGAADSPEGALMGGALIDNRATAMEASPVTHVSEGDPPVLIAHGTKDRLVPHMQSVELAKGLREAGTPVVFITMENAGHGFRSAELQGRVSHFLARHLLGEESVISSEAIPLGE